MTNPKIEKASRIYRTDGVQALVRKAAGFLSRELGERYNSYLRPHIPYCSEYGLFNGVAVSSPRLRYFDTLVPWETAAYNRGYKQTNVEAVTETVRPGDTVVIVGGGKGVTAVHVASAVGSEGTVIIYEGDAVRAEELEATLSRHGVGQRCRIEVALVGRGYLASNTGGTDRIQPEDLPACDVLEMDCEGAEYGVLSTLAIDPRNVIVETHYKKSYAPYESEDEITGMLTERGYSVERRTGDWVNSLLVGTRT